MITTSKKPYLKRAWPIRRFIYAVVIATALPLCVYIARGILRESHEAEDDAQHLVLAIASAAAAQARERLRETEFFAKALASRPLVRALDRLNCDPLIGGLLALLPQYANISVLDREGRFVCSALPLESRDQMAPLHAGIMGALEGRFAVSDPLVGVMPPRLMVSAGYPVRDASGAVAGVVTAPIDLAALRPIVDSAALPANARVRLIDAHGVLLASSIPNDPELGKRLRGTGIVERVLAGSTGAARLRDADQVQRIYAYTAVGTNGWHAYASMPAPDLLDTARRQTRSSVLLAAGMLAIGLLGGALVARGISRPAASLVQTMAAVGAGHNTHARPAGPLELRAVAEHFNRMLDARLEAEAALRESEMTRRLAVRASHTGLWDWDVKSGVVRVSAESMRQLGHEEKEVLCQYDEWANRLHPTERAVVVNDLRRVLASGRSEQESEYRLRRKDGSYCWIYSRAEVIRDAAGAPLRMLGSHVEITARKEMEQTLQRTVSELRELSMRLMEVEEAERRNISRELHDRTGANVAALHITLGLLADRLAAGETAAALRLLDNARVVLTQTSSEIRNIMAELRPSVLDDFGLYPALLSHARSVASRLGVELRTSGDEGLPRLPTAVETALYRIAQEALTNVAKHAHATMIELELHHGQDALVLCIRDDGTGFDAGSVPVSGHHGMRTMRERADAIGAKLRVVSAPGAGTQLTVELELT